MFFHCDKRGVSHYKLNSKNNHHQWMGFAHEKNKKLHSVFFFFFFLLATKKFPLHCGLAVGYLVKLCKFRSTEHSGRVAPRADWCAVLFLLADKRFRHLVFKCYFLRALSYMDVWKQHNQSGQPSIWCVRLQFCVCQREMKARKNMFFFLKEELSKQVIFCCLWDPSPEYFSRSYL